MAIEPILEDSLAALENIEDAIGDLAKQQTTSARRASTGGGIGGGATGGGGVGIRAGVAAGVAGAVVGGFLREFEDVIGLAIRQLQTVDLGVPGLADKIREAIQTKPVVSAARTVGDLAEQAGRLGVGIDPNLLRARAREELAAERAGFNARIRAEGVVLSESGTGTKVALGAAAVAGAATLFILR